MSPEMINFKDATGRGAVGSRGVRKPCQRGAGFVVHTLGVVPRALTPPTEGAVVLYPH